MIRKGPKAIHTLSFEMPTTYEPPLGTPLYWRNEVTGVLGAAIWAYIAHGAEPTVQPAPSAEQLALVVAYLRYVINAPCWHGGMGLAVARIGVEKLATVEDVQTWIMGCLEIGIDPL